MKKIEKIKISGFTTPKKGQEPEENQDGISFLEKEHVFAISDGASLSPRSGLWSRILTDNFTKNPYEISNHNEKNLTKWLKKPRKEWVDKCDMDSLPKGIQIKLKNSGGSSSTFMGCIHKKQKSKNFLEIMYTGDTCFFKIRKNKMINKIPYTKSNQFSSRTTFLTSSKEKGGEKTIKTKKIPFLPGDIIIVATDELAKWILNRKENGENPWSKLVKMTEKKFPKFVEKIRNDREVDDDDMSFIVFTIISEKNEKITNYV